MAGEVLLRTPRFVLRRWRADEAARLETVYGDDDAMRWVGEGRAITPEQCREWVRKTFDNYAQRGYGMFAVDDAQTGELLGYCGIVHPGGQPEPEIKYALHRSQWGHGLATEVVRAVLGYAQHTLGLRWLIATVSPEHLASQRVLDKAGLRRGGLRPNEDGSHTQLYEWHAPG